MGVGLYVDDARRYGRLPTSCRRHLVLGPPSTGDRTDPRADPSKRFTPHPPSPQRRVAVACPAAGRSVGSASGDLTQAPEEGVRGPDPPMGIHADSLDKADAAHFTRPLPKSALKQMEYLVKQTKGTQA